MFIRIAALTVLFVSLSAHAAGLDDLKSALQRLPGSQPIKAQIGVKSQSHQGDGDELSNESGAATIMIEESAQGLLMQIGPDMLARSQAEALAKEADKKAKAPTTIGLSKLDVSAIRAMTSAGESLKHSINGFTFRSERVDTWNGQPARLLSFEMDASKMDKMAQKYVKSFESSLQIWIAADGTPLESRSRMKTSGRAFLVVSFETSNNSRTVYQRTGDRLVATRIESNGGVSGMGMGGDGTSEYTLQLQR